MKFSRLTTSDVAIRTQNLIIAGNIDFMKAYFSSWCDSLVSI